MPKDRPALTREEEELRALSMARAELVWGVVDRKGEVLTVCALEVTAERLARGCNGIVCRVPVFKTMRFDFPHVDPEQTTFIPSVIAYPTPKDQAETLRRQGAGPADLARLKARHLGMTEEEIALLAANP